MSDHAAGLKGLFAALFAFASIGLGTLVGASRYQGLTEPSGVWLQQLGSVVSYYRQWMEQR